MVIEAEKELKKYLVLCQECGFGLTRHELRVLAFNFMEKAWSYSQIQLDTENGWA
jgi:hypothetical protein